MAENGNRSERSALQKSISFLSAAPNRGLLLDLFVFFLNLAVMFALAKLFAGTIQKAAAGDNAAEIILFSMAICLFCLAPVGATLKRWHFHQSAQSAKTGDWSDHMGGCLFNPIFYFCLTAVIFAAVNAFILQTIYGRKEPDGAVFVSSIFGGIVLMILHTVLVYRYFTPPKSPPKSSFLRSRASAFIGDACLFANMVLFQLIWNLLSAVEAPPPSGVFDFVFRFLILCFLALLLYFPPRMFYLAEDIGKRRTWLMILLANSPILARFMFGLGTGIKW